MQFFISEQDSATDEKINTCFHLEFLRKNVEENRLNIEFEVKILAFMTFIEKSFCSFLNLTSLPEAANKLCCSRLKTNQIHNSILSESIIIKCSFIYKNTFSVIVDTLLYAF